MKIDWTRVGRTCMSLFLFSLIPQGFTWMHGHSPWNSRARHCFRNLPKHAKRKHNSFLLGPSCVTMCASGIKIEVFVYYKWKTGQKEMMPLHSDFLTFLDHKMFFIIHYYKTEAFLLFALKIYVAIIQNTLLTFIYPKEEVYYVPAIVSNSPFPRSYPSILAPLHVNIYCKGRKDYHLGYQVIK